MSGAEHSDLDGFGPVPDCAQAVGFPPAAAPWVGYRCETSLASGMARRCADCGWLVVDVHCGNAMYPVTGIAGTVSRGGCDVCGLAAALSDDGSRLLARSRQFAPVAIHVRILPDKGALGFAGVVRGNSLGIFRDSIQVQVIQATGEKRRLWGE